MPLRGATFLRENENFEKVLTEIQKSAILKSQENKNRFAHRTLLMFGKTDPRIGRCSPFYALFDFLEFIKRGESDATFCSFPVRFLSFCKNKEEL